MINEKIMKNVAAEMNLHVSRGFWISPVPSA